MPQLSATPVAGVSICVVRDNEVLLAKRAKKLARGLWSLPEDESSRALVDRYGLHLDNLRAMPLLEHRLTHRLLRIHALLGQSDQALEPDGKTARWTGPLDVSDLGLPRPVAGLLQSVWADQG